MSAVRREVRDGVNVYHLAAGRPGVPARIEVRPTWCGLREEITAFSPDGSRLLTENRWRLGSGEAVCRDPQARVETRLDLDSLRLEISAYPNTVFKGLTEAHGSQEMIQVIEPDGHMLVKSHMRSVTQVYTTPAAHCGVGAAVTMVSQHFVETEIPVRGRPASEMVQVDGLVQTRRPIRSQLDPGGSLSLDLPDSGRTTVPLYIAPGALFPRGL